MRKPDKRNAFPYLSLAIIVGIAGLWLRAKGLGKWPLAVDEYYLISSIENIIRTGLPEFLCGGYYIRGILQQYLTVPLRLLLDDPELSARLIPLISNMAALPAVYLICRQVGGRAAAVVGVFLMAFSLWEIEFSRFGRMYAPFQAIIVWQVWLMLQPVKPSSNANTWISYGLAILASGIYAGAIFSWCLAILNPVVSKKTIHIRDVIAWTVIGVVVVIPQIIPFRHLGVGQYLPLDYVQQGNFSGTSLPFLLPDSVLALTENSLFLTLCAIVLGLWGLSVLVFSIRKYPSIGFLNIVCVLISVTGVVSNQIVLFVGGLLVIFLLDKKNAVLWFVQNRLKFVIYLSAVLIWFLVLCIYIAFASYDLGMRSVIKEIISTIASYPDFYFRIFKQWFAAMPFQTSLVVILSSLALLLGLRNGDKKNQQLLLLLGLILILLMVTAVIRTFYVDSRYTFYLYPLVLACCAAVIVRLVPKYFTASFRFLSIFVLSSVFFYISDDYSVKNSIGIDSERVNFRLDYNGPRTRHYYPRLDFQGAANFINFHRSQQSILITSVSVVDYYLDENVQSFFYMPMSHDEFLNRSSCEGKYETWSGANLLYKEKDFIELVNNPKQERWVVIYGPGKKITLPPLNSLIDDRLAKFHVYDSLEDAIHVFRIPMGAKAGL